MRVLGYLKRLRYFDVAAVVDGFVGRLDSDISDS